MGHRPSYMKRIEKAEASTHAKYLRQAFVCKQCGRVTWSEKRVCYFCTFNVKPPENRNDTKVLEVLERASILLED